MDRNTTARKATVCLVLALAAVALCSPTDAAAASGRTPAAPASTAPAKASPQLIGQVSGPTYLEASAPTAGRYVIEYRITGNAAFDTYLNGTELGYVGGSTGTYRTRPVQLSASGLLVQVTGPEGSGSASVYLVQIS